MWRPLNLGMWLVLDAIVFAARHLPLSNDITSERMEGTRWCLQVPCIRIGNVKHAVSFVGACLVFYIYSELFCSGSVQDLAWINKDFWGVFQYILLYL